MNRGPLETTLASIDVISGKGFVKSDMFDNIWATATNNKITSAVPIPDTRHAWTFSAEQLIKLAVKESEYHKELRSRTRHIEDMRTDFERIPYDPARHKDVMYLHRDVKWLVENKFVSMTLYANMVFYSNPLISCWAILQPCRDIIVLCLPSPLCRSKAVTDLEPKRI